MCLLVESCYMLYVYSLAGQQSRFVPSELSIAERFSIWMFVALFYDCNMPLLDVLYCLLLTCGIPVGH